MTDDQPEHLDSRLWPQPPSPVEKPAAPGVVNYIKAWALFRQIPIEQLGSLAVLIPLIVFFAVSGFIAWAAIMLGLFLRVLWSVFRGLRRGK